MRGSQESLPLTPTRMGVSECTDDPRTGHGEIFTHRWVVELILDLAGYTLDRDLGALVAVEPACGAGAFLVPMVERLVASCERHGRPLRDAIGAIRAYDLLERNVDLARKAAAGALTSAGVVQDDADRLCASWVRGADFLLRANEPGSADFVLGNPPYLRLENVPRARLRAYRATCPSMRGRSDVYVGFIEQGLRLLRAGGTLGFIVADRWMRNQYGRALRSLISDGFAVSTVIHMHDVDAFEDPVAAYPAVTIIRRAAHSTAVLAETSAGFGAPEAAQLKEWAQRRASRAVTAPAYRAARLDSWFRGDGFWPMGSPEDLALVADLERRHPPLEDPTTGTKVGIGVATGADRVFLTDDPDLVERDRLLPLVLAKDIVGGRIDWSGTFLVSPWAQGRLVDLDDHPKLAAYLRGHERRLRARHVGRRNPTRWYRTIDRVAPHLAGRPKLLLPDLKAAIHPVLDPGGLYPHHNLYVVTSGGWDLETLGGLLLSGIANLFVGTYCVKMRGGCYRFQAQYLRRIRVPRLDRISAADRQALAHAFADRDVEAATAVARRLYGVAG